MSLMISVIGGDAAPPEAVADAEAVGRELARRGCTVVCGGRGGVMEGVCRGAREEGGHTIGILPGPDTTDMNPYVEFPIVTGIGYARNAIVVLSGHAVIAIDGAYGTLSEIAHALQFDRPVIGLGTWHIAANGREDGRIIRAANPLDAVEKAVAAARSRAIPEPERPRD
ncbi:MAG TPA: TIGR00725 family protein [Dehalococcoidia bacterium]